jgi:hypothetical protein
MQNFVCMFSGTAPTPSNLKLDVVVFLSWLLFTDSASESHSRTFLFLVYVCLGMRQVPMERALNLAKTNFSVFVSLYIVPVFLALEYWKCTFGTRAEFQRKWSVYENDVAEKLRHKSKSDRQLDKNSLRYITYKLQLFSWKTEGQVAFCASKSRSSPFFL